MGKMGDNAAKAKSKEFSIKAVQLYRQLSGNKKETVLSERFLRAAAGTGANLARADCAFNKNEYITMLNAALQDCAEANYWLEVLNESEFLTEFEFTSNAADCDELHKMLLYAIKTLRAAPVPPPVKPQTDQ
jgi:four helix bundle protein